MRSLRSRWIIASVLWTAGLLALMHVFAILALVHIFPPAVSRSHGWMVIVLGLILMLAGFKQVRASFTPFHELHQRLVALRTGADHRITGRYPTEVQPLVDDLNKLLEERDQAVQRALATAGDLAHGLKTPLALLAQEADRAEAAGNTALAESIAEQVERMSRQVNYHLARARAAASRVAGAAPLAIAPCAEAVIRTLSKLHAARALTISSCIPPTLHVRVEREDLEEMLGNLLDNACHWAKSRIELSASPTGTQIVLLIDDDGPGLPAPLRTVVLHRGVRLDEAAPGSGLGLAIVRDLAELYGGSISLDASPLGGLRARLTLPGNAAATAPTSSR